MRSSQIRILFVSLLAVFAFSAVASASSASAHEWVICSEFTEAKFEYETLSKCWKNEKITPPKTGKWEREETGKHVAVTSTSGTSTLTAGTKKITCTADTDKGWIEAGGAKDEAEEIKFTGCTTAQTGCKPTGGTIVVKAVLTELVMIGATLADEFKPTPPATKFVTITFEGTCSEYPTTEVTGHVAGEVENATESINFPSPELAGNTLNAFGKAAKLVSKDKQKTVSGGSIHGV